MDIKNLIPDADKSLNGVLVEYTEGVRFRVASINNPKYESRIQRLMQPYANPAKRHQLNDPDLMRRMQIDAEAETILLGWEGLENNGVPFDYSIANAKVLLFQSPEIRAFIREEATRQDNYRQAAIQEAAANLKSGPEVVDSVGQ